MEAKALVIAFAFLLAGCSGKQSDTPNETGVTGAGATPGAIHITLLANKADTNVTLSVGNLSMVTMAERTERYESLLAGCSEGKAAAEMTSDGGAKVLGEFRQPCGKSPVAIVVKDAAGLQLCASWGAEVGGGERENSECLQ